MNNLSRTDRIERHAIKRARQRYEVGPDVVDRVRRLIRRAIKESKRKRPVGVERPALLVAVRIKSEGINRSLWRVTDSGESYIVVFEDATEIVVTFLPKDAQP